jgi:3-oxoacyl-(acyl-carrier-protein) synthase
MPGELSNVLAGRIANLFNFRGPNFTTDAACASGLAATWAAIHGLNSHQYDAVVTGGIDRNMSVTGFVKFCKIGALSATGTRPFDAGADGVVMGEGAAIFVLKRLADAERDGDRSYAVLLGLAGSSDGKGRHHRTEPRRSAGRSSTLGARRESAQPRLPPWRPRNLHPGRGRAELESLTRRLPARWSRPGLDRPQLGEVNIGHLKGCGRCRRFVQDDHEPASKTLPPSLNFVDPNPNVDWATSPFLVNTELREWPVQPAGGAARRGEAPSGSAGRTSRRARGVRPRSASGRGSGPSRPAARRAKVVRRRPSPVPPSARGALVVGEQRCRDRHPAAEAKAQAEAGSVPADHARSASLAGAQVRLAIDYGEAASSPPRPTRRSKAFGAENRHVAMLRCRVFLGSRPRTEGRVPLHRTGLAVRQHAQVPA